MVDIRSNPPMSVRTFAQHEAYRTFYDDLTENGIELQYHDRHGLGELATMSCEMNDLRQSLEEDGEQMKVQGDRNKITKKNPARDALEKIRPHFFRLLKEFKMTPSSRGNSVGFTPANSTTPKDNYDDV